MAMILRDIEVSRIASFERLAVADELILAHHEGLSDIPVNVSEDIMRTREGASSVTKEGPDESVDGGRSDRR